MSAYPEHAHDPLPAWMSQRDKRRIGALLQLADWLDSRASRRDGFEAQYAEYIRWAVRRVIAVTGKQPLGDATDSVP